jgi:Icc-related predicted phosphoesterase
MDPRPFYLATACLSAALSGAAPAVGEGGPERQDQTQPDEVPALTGWDRFAEERSGNCLGPAGDLDKPLEIAAGKHSYRLYGHRLVQLDQDRDKILRIGVISAVKDDRPETLQAVKHMIALLKRKKIDVVVANGDLATDEFQMETVFPALADAGVLVIATTGNTESCGSFNKIATDTFKSHPNFINGNWVRRIELDDATLLTVPGYYDRRFVHTGGASVYNTEDLNVLERMSKNLSAPIVLVSHGPPKMSGKQAIDVATDVGNVGDPGLLELIKDLKIPFGIFGHILEAGGRATDLSGKKVLKPKKWAKELYANAGTLNPDPWKMLDGKSSYGIALYVEVEKKRARFEVLRMPKPRD